MAYIMNRDSIGVALDGTTRGSDGAHTFLVDLSYKHDAPGGAKKSLCRRYAAILSRATYRTNNRNKENVPVVPPDLHQLLTVYRRIYLEMFFISRRKMFRAAEITGNRNTWYRLTGCGQQNLCMI